MHTQYHAGQLCPTGGQYGQFRDHDGRYAGPEFDRFVSQGHAFPPAMPGYHYRYGGLQSAFPAAPLANRQTTWDPNDPIAAG